MGHGDRVESAIVRTLRVTLALLLLPTILVYAAVACVVYPGALVVGAVHRGVSLRRDGAGGSPDRPVSDLAVMGPA
jgi:hypothetical protein